MPLKLAELANEENEELLSGMGIDIVNRMRAAGYDMDARNQEDAQDMIKDIVLFLCDWFSKAKKAE